MSKIKNKIFTFNLEQNLTTSDSIYFKLFAYGSQNNEVTPEGDPTNFYIKYDGVAPTLLSPSSTSEIYLTSENLDINLNFNEKLSSYEVFLDTQLIKIKDSEEFLSSYPNTIDVNINKEDLTEGANNNLTVIVTDLAGNSNEYVLNVFYRGEEIKMTLLTKDDDSALKYYYNKNYPDFFNKTIYSSENIYNLKVETSKPAICYYTDSLSFYRLTLNPGQRDSLFWISKYGILRSNDAGETWSDMKLLTPPGSVNIYAFAINPKNQKEIYYTGTILGPKNEHLRSTFYRTVDGGENWVTKKLPTNSIPIQFVMNTENSSQLFLGFTSLSK